MRRSKGGNGRPKEIMRWALRSRTYSPIPHVVRHRRPVALPAGQHRLMPVSQCTLRADVLYMCLRTDDKTSAHRKTVKEHSISNRLLWGAIAHITMRFRQRNIPEAEVDGPRERGLQSTVVSPEVRFAALVRTSIRAPRIGTRLDDRRGPRHAKLKSRAAWTDPSLCAVGVWLDDWLAGWSCWLASQLGLHCSGRSRRTRSGTSAQRFWCLRLGMPRLTDLVRADFQPAGAGAGGNT